MGCPGVMQGAVDFQECLQADLPILDRDRVSRRQPLRIGKDTIYPRPEIEYHDMCRIKARIHLIHDRFARMRHGVHSQKHSRAG